jgi:broad specificity phosphatase PhoE
MLSRPPGYRKNRLGFTCDPKGCESIAMTGCYYLLRHGETEWSKTGRHTGRTDIGLTEDGKARAADIAPMLRHVTFQLVLCSPLSRARDTANLAGLSPDDYVDDLLEWDYGVYEGRTTTDIREEKEDPTWVIWDDPIPDGERPSDVGQRAARVLARTREVIDAGGNVALVAHGHFLRILTAIHLGLPADAGRLFALDAGGVAVLGHERTQPTINGWNITPEGL